MNDDKIKNYLITSYPDRGVVFEKGEGIYLIDREGKRYLDLGSNYGVSVFGYNHPRIIPALIDQMGKLITLHGSFGSQVRNTAAKELVKKCGGKMSRVFFSNSGSEAIEGALKFVKLASGKSKFVALSGSYHGKTLGALSATSGDKYRDSFKPLIWEFSHVSINDNKTLDTQLTSDTAAFILEPVQGEGGIHLFSKEDIFFVQKLCKERNILIIVDEIQTGVGRTGTFLASEQYGLEPDVVCLAKGIAGGIPVGVTLVSEEIAQKIPIHVHTSTFGGNPLACAGILAVLKEFEDGRLLKHITGIGEYFLSKLKQLEHPKIKDTRGIGLMLAIELFENATPILKALQMEKFIVIPAGSNIVRFLPPYLITKKEIDTTMNVLKKIFS